MIRIELERAVAANLIEALERRLEVIQALETAGGALLVDEFEREKSAIVPTLIALEAALKLPPRQ
ncbi:hypothetical protein [Methylosinus sp. Sm6]|uniref:hypothetical protein n=1 Tax=Methylosinus sp. Sm6 TaxID=2866948 RepID=UPI001C9A0ED8|nr:hypothetical protein [Methylosinus sp. Sm6]MBY6241269.1 hypothetical protein [Methylosinus sp. Sm6]